VVITDLYYPTEDFDIIEIFAENGQIRLGEALFTELKSIWK
jgi:fructan beta-fructosidase